MTPDWALTLIFWVHMLATVAWIGGLAVLVLIFLPIVTKTLEAAEQSALLEQVQRRFDPLAWLCLILLLATGMFQMSANPNYEGMLGISNRWSVAIFVKHLLFLGMIGVNAVMSMAILPGLRRVSLLRQKGMDAPQADQLNRREQQLLRLNLSLGVLILALTALARIS
jgi:uncharacterized membrane protein